VNVILDTNLLLLLFVGTTSRNYIAKHRRLTAYTVADFDLLLSILSGFGHVVTTPGILAETSNFVRNIAEPAASQIGLIFRAFFSPPIIAQESFLPATIVVQAEEFIRLGITDAAILLLLDDTRVLLTADLDLYLAALRNGKNAENFNYLRNL
jgi:hypothetical protein